MRDACPHCYRHPAWEVEDEIAKQIAAWLRALASAAIADLQPADAREAEDVRLTQLVEQDIASAVERGDWRKK